MAAPNEITVPQLLRLIGLPDAPVIVDISIDPDFEDDPFFRHRPKIDRIACPWLIRRFIDPQGEFLFVSPAEVMGVADRFGAAAFDVPDTFWSHRDDACTFDTMLDEFNLHTEALDRVATIVRAADTNTHDAAPEATGLLALSVGLSRQYKDDLMQLEAGLVIYDALYRWARDGQGEGHDWPGGKA